ncbi:MAG: phage shock protein operon transcriptional activator [Sphingomonadaceae bacterium]|nr:phage shock protein operon transcriptional activator [Sphingomonadaceae bacterium]
MASPSQLVGQSSAFLDAIERASLAARLDRPVLVIGERGTGKELIAERLHRLSARWDGPLIVMNCAALPESLIDSELFGHEAGSFTGASKQRAGRFEEADGGTLFLDEIGTLSVPAQERLLRVVEYGQLLRVGGSRPVTVDVRLVGAANVDLPALAAEGKFRADLLDRLSFEVITLPPLRVRGEDILVLAEHFGRRMAAELGWARFPGFASAVRERLERHSWPGNVRELRNAVERSLYRWGDETTPIGEIELDPFESPWRPKGETSALSRRPDAAPIDPIAEAAAEPADFRAAVGAYEKRLLERALSRCRHNQRAAAAALGLSYDQLRHCLRKHGILERSSA